MNRILIFSITLLLSTIILFGQSAKRPITIDDYFKIKSVEEPRISPEGNWIAFLITEKNFEENSSETNLWMIPIQGGEAIQMTSQGYSASNHRWSPNGKYLSFLASKGKDAKSQVWALDRQGGEAKQMTNVKQGVSGYEWSPSSKDLVLRIRDQKPALLNDDESDDKAVLPHVIDRLQFKRDGVGYLDTRKTHLFLFAITSKKMTQLTEGDYDDYAPTWSPDGSQIAFVSNRSENSDANSNDDIWTVSTDTSHAPHDPVQVTKDKARQSSPRWSPDGKYLLYRTNARDWELHYFAQSSIEMVALQNGAITQLTTDLDRNAYGPRFADDGKSIWFYLENEGEEQLATVDLGTKIITRKIGDVDLVWEFDFRGDTLVTLSGGADRPFELFTHINGHTEQITFFNKDFLDTIHLSHSEKILFTSKDGAQIHGFLYKPIGFTKGQKYPTIVWIHGGPVAQYNQQYSHRTQLFTAHGYVVLHLNPRGSSGFGLTYSKAIFADWGNVDYQDILAGVDYAIEQGYTDPARVGVGGWSYGGILTNHLITKTDRFKAAISGASLTLYRANYGHDQWQRNWELELGLPWENKMLWEKLSPFNQVEKITTPTLWMGGEKDWNTPIMNSEIMYQAMKRLGRETQLVVYPGESHWPMRRHSFVKDRWERYLAWFDKYLKGEPNKK